MQCISCQFENMPGVRACGRCGSPLEVQAVAVDVHPPRAPRWSKPLRRWLPLGPLYYQARDAGGPLLRSVEDARNRIPPTPLGVIARLIVPGWAAYHLGQRASGCGFFLLYLGLLLCGLVLYGTWLGGILVGLAFGVHVSASLSVLRLSGTGSPAFWGAVLIIMALLAGVVYLPAGWLLSRAVASAMVQVDGTPFAEGDVILYSPAAYAFHPPRPGDVVLYQRPGGNFRLEEQHANLVLQGGPRIDRILAGPGDQVRWQLGRLEVNGQPAPWQPLVGGRYVPDLDLTVPQGCFLIFPSSGPPLPAGLPRQVWLTLAIVPARSIEGRVWLRSFPWTRLQRFS
jgi:type IV secretory pathway protease TraF